MRTLFKTIDVVKWLYEHDCDDTATTIHEECAGVEFLDSSMLRKYLINELYETIENSISKYTYKTNTLW